MKPFRIKDAVIYQDDEICVINKPADLSVLPDGWQPDSPFLLKLLREKFPGMMVVHRLDKITSGVIVFACTAEAHRNLNIQFERHSIQKIYHAICENTPKWDEHTARHKLRVNIGHNHRTAVDNGRGKPAETRFTILERMRGYTLLEASPATGRTHQIRVHAMALGYPLLGDTFYGAAPSELIDRPALHAHTLTFTHPGCGEPVTFNAAYPQDFQNALDKIRAGH